MAKEVAKLELEICREIIEARDCGVVRCQILEIEPLPLAELAPKFDLLFSPDTYREIKKGQARKTIELILYQDLAYDCQMMERQLAKDLTARFLAYFEDESARYYTNNYWHEEPPLKMWHPATTATFDTGIIIVGRLRAGCVWVADEN